MCTSGKNRYHLHFLNEQALRNQEENNSKRLIDRQTDRQTDRQSLPEGWEERCLSLEVLARDALHVT
jgi:hypothetical protein